MIYRKQHHTQSLAALLLALLVFLISGSLPAQTPQVLDDYIRQAYASSHVLKEKQFQLDRSMLALEEAKRLFYPDVNFNLEYTLAAGGRTIAFPIGDLLNPVYSTLNGLTQTNSFPQLENVNEQFLPNNFYNTFIRTRQPLINAEIKYNRAIKASQVSLQEIDLQLYRRELAKEIKMAYFRYLQATEAIAVYQNALELLRESRRVNESLLRNDKAIPGILVRTDSELAAVEAQLADARNQQRNASAYFNHLLNRDLEEAIVADTSLTLPINSDIDNTPILREELQQLSKAQEINQLLVRLEESYRVPNVGLQLDLGSQNFDFKWGGYALLGLSVQVPLWTANRNKLQVQQAQVAGYALQEQTRQVEEQIELQIRTSRNSLQTELEIWQSYQKQVDGARRFYSDTFRRYREGVANYIELLDARTQLTNLEIRRSISYFNVLIRQAELERALGAYGI